MSSSLCGSLCKSSACTTSIRYDEARYVWTIEDFDFLEAKGERLCSPVFSSVKNDQVEWFLTLYPIALQNAVDHISLYIYLSAHSSFEKTKKIFTKADFSILNEQYQEKYKQTATIKEFPHPDVEIKTTGIWKFIKKDATFRNKLLFNNTLRIRCDVKFSDVKNITSSSQRCECYIEVPECDLSENFVSLFENQEFTDVILSVNGKDYPAHKTILAARSPVFHAMFKHNTKENQQNRIDIEDITEAVVVEMLKYIYTGKCANLETLAGELLAAADKYDLYRLKMMCAKTLFERLSVENAASVLALSDMHGVKELKNRVIKFIVSKPTEVLGTKGWKSVRSNFELADEVCSALARRLEAKTAD